VDRGVFTLPKEVSFEEGTFIEPLACVLRGQRVAQFKAGQSVLVLGSGISGLLHIMLAKAMGAGKIIATDINEYRLNAARKAGADEVLSATEDIPARVHEINGRGIDLAIVCTGAYPAFGQALKSVDRGGTVLFFAATEPGVELPVPVNEFWRNSITLLPSYGNSPFDATVAIELIRAKRVAVRELITHRLPMKDTAEGFKLVAASAESIKVIIEPHT
ncbi:MAG: zinc-binding dehydrogenase, partial [bacterium]|nr:zinc-binding dehydrogenase [bacterium]